MAGAREVAVCAEALTSGSRTGGPLRIPPDVIPVIVRARATHG